MGGNLFQLGRLPRDQYLAIEHEIRAYLDRAFGAAFYRVPRYYGDKADFGDLDVILSDAIDASRDAIRARIVADLGITRHKLTGAVFSTVYRDFQVDYFLKSAAIFESTYNFLSFNDLGNLLGKMFRRFNLKYGEDGLFWVFRRKNGSYRRDILLSRDHRRIFGFLELDPGPWEQGFGDLEAMFRWVLASPFFSVEPFLDRRDAPAFLPSGASGRSSSTEKRMKLRPTMRAFVAFLEREGITRAYPFEPDRARYIPRVTEHFGEVDLPAVLAHEEAAETRADALRSKLDGHVVMEEVPGLEGKALGAFLQAFRGQFDDFEDRILRASADEVRAMIRAFAARSQKEDP